MGVRYIICISGVFTYKKKKYQNESIPEMSEIIPKEWYVWDISPGVSDFQLLSHLNLKK